MFLQVAISAKEVKKLRDATGAGMMDCKKALVEFGGDVEAAMEELRKKGLASADKKASRAAKEGIIETYIHTGAKLGVMVEVNCETDFVAKRPEFQELAKAVAMQIAASPTVEVVSEADIDADFVEKEKKIESQSEDLQGKPDAIVAKIVEGRVAKLIKTKLLLEQYRDEVCRSLRALKQAKPPAGSAAELAWVYKVGDVNKDGLIQQNEVLLRKRMKKRIENSNSLNQFQNLRGSFSTVSTPIFASK